MKQILFIALLIGAVGIGRASAQLGALELPESSLIQHYKVFVAYSTTTVLVFPAAVRPLDRGDRDVIAQKQPGVENVLKLKAARRGFSPTNLHVFTSDGAIYAFDVYYTENLATTHNLANLLSFSPQVGPVISFSTGLPNTDQLSRYEAQVKALPVIHIARDRQNRMKLSLGSIGMAGNLLFFRLKLSNLSQLDYSIDFVRLYVRDREKAKRSSVQELEVAPVYEDTTNLVSGGHTLTHILAVPIFTLADNKEFLMEVYEKNGGRSLKLRITNKDLFKLRKL